MNALIAARSTCAAAETRPPRTDAHRDGERLPPRPRGHAEIREVRPATATTARGRRPRRTDATAAAPTRRGERRVGERAPAPRPALRTGSTHPPTTTDDEQHVRADLAHVVRAACCPEIVGHDHGQRRSEHADRSRARTRSDPSTPPVRSPSRRAAVRYDATTSSDHDVAPGPGHAAGAAGAVTAERHAGRERGHREARSRRRPRARRRPADRRGDGQGDRARPERASSADPP